uniref:Uncharacterized protein n=1 Tax=Molossus molossus TaxID=27622 RepID=A0A7J8J6P9_MOLMO|nr:hypothetical protein HJG59_009693 [Molossus molossus]
MQLGDRPQSFPHPTPGQGGNSEVNSQNAHSRYLFFKAPWEVCLPSGLTSPLPHQSNLGPPPTKLSALESLSRSLLWQGGIPDEAMSLPKKKNIAALAGLAQRLEHRTARRDRGSVPAKGTYLGCSLSLALVGCAGGDHSMCPFHIDVSLSLCSSLSPSHCT